MRLEHIHPFVESAREVLQAAVDAPVRAGRVRLQASPAPSRGVAAIVALAGEVDGRVILDMDQETAMRLAGCMNAARFGSLTPLAQDTLAELAGMLAGRAVSALHDRGFRLEPAPPVLVVGDNLTVTSPGPPLEALAIPLDTSLGEVMVNVAVRMA